jgi:hypothetical protein
MAQTIILAGEEVEVYELPIRQNRAWRERAKVPLTAQKQLAEDAKAADDGLALASLYNRYIDMVDDYGDLICDLVLDYLPDQGRRDYYADRATEPEVLQAFIVLVRLAFSTGFFWALTGAALTSGSADPATGTNSPAPSGASGSMN